jgi:hypothetical protein
MAVKKIHLRRPKPLDEFAQDVGSGSFETVCSMGGRRTARALFPYGFFKLAPALRCKHCVNIYSARARPNGEAAAPTASGAAALALIS